MPTISFHLGTKEGEERRERKKNIDDGEDTNCLFIWNIFLSEGRRASEKKKGFIPFCILEMIDLLSQ